MITTFLTLWLLVISIQLVFILFVYSRTAFHRPPNQTNGVSQPGISIVVCARNERVNLIELLPLLNAQQYAEFEVLVMDDRSTDGTRAYLENDIAHLDRVRFIRIERAYDHVTPKKYALTIALKNVLYPTVLLTDADCRPATNHWLAGMVSSFSDPRKEIVLGFSPYERRAGFLNLLIRSETLFTAVQYFSLALAGRPYMGVGRNLAYRTRLFFANRGFYSHMNVLGGDDDLFMNEVATGRNTAVCLEPDTFAWSGPKETWTEWQLQKRRHLHVGNYYKRGHKLRLGLLTGSHVLTWMLALGSGLFVLTYTLRHQPFATMEWLLLLTGTGVFVARWLLFWGVVGRISYRLGHTVHWSLIPLVDLILAIYYGLAGLRTLVIGRKKTYFWR